METFKPPINVVQEAKRAVGWIKEHKEGKGFTRVGIARAYQLAKREPVSYNTVKRMHSYFSRHTLDQKAEGFKKGEKGYPSAGRVAWDAWGGEHGKEWADRITQRERR